MKNKDFFLMNLQGKEVPVWLKKSERARRLILRVLPSYESEKMDGLLLSIPNGVEEREAKDFIIKQSNWALRQLSKLPPLIKICHGAKIPFLGDYYNIVHEPTARRGVWRKNSSIYVSGRSEFLSRRMKTWLKKEAKIVFTSHAIAKTELINKKFGKITVRDTRSRWGSCSTNGNLSFSWRLIMAPDFVCEYAAAHEVAHIIEKNHGRKFWDLTNFLCSDMMRAKKWIKKNGERLLRYN